jgi:hypothetical protein
MTARGNLLLSSVMVRSRQRFEAAVKYDVLRWRDRSNAARTIMIWVTQHSYKSAWQDAVRQVERLAMHHRRV